MREDSPEQRRPLRTGYTTGACATAVSLAAARLLLNGNGGTSCTITLPRGPRVEFKLEYCRLRGGGAEAATIKDAGDDPDVTHRALIFAWVELKPRPGVRFRAGSGVGIVTREGLSLAVGEPAINPVPRRMITEHLQALADETGYLGGFKVTIGVENGEEIAKKTMNARLGIIGGLSILGTTGIVRPFSCSAYIASIQQGIDVARANGIEHIAVSTGATSEEALRRYYHLPEMALIEMGDFVGAVLKYLQKAPVPRLSLAGGFGKISKLAAGQMNLHSHNSSIDLAFLAALAAELGADLSLQERIYGANTSQQVLAWCQAAGLPLGDRICALARAQAEAVVPDTVAVEVWAFDRQGHRVGRAGFL